MARLIWAEPALNGLEEIAEYIALENPTAACRRVKDVLEKVERLEAHPKSGRRPPELKDMHCREIIVSPCRVFYRTEKDAVCVLYVMRSERLLRSHLLDLREDQE